MRGLGKRGFPSPARRACRHCGGGNPWCFMTDALSPTVTTTDDNKVTAVITGEFDMPATFTTEPALEGALERPDLRSFTLDLTGSRSSNHWGSVS